MERKDYCGIILFNKNKEILLQKKTKDYFYFPGGYWCLFGGRVEKGENPEKAARRELKEELGAKAKKLKSLVKQKYSRLDLYGDNYVFIYQIKKPISKLRIKEGAGFAFFSKSEIKNLKVTSVSKRAINYFFKLKNKGK